MLRLPRQLQILILSAALLAIPQVVAVDAEHDAHPQTTPAQDEANREGIIEHEPMGTPESAISTESEEVVKAPETPQETKKQVKKKKKKKKKAMKKKHKREKKRLKKKQKEEKKELKEHQKEEDMTLERESPPQE